MMPKYVVVVEQRGERTIEVFDRFDDMLHQWYNFGLCDCTVVDIKCQFGPGLSERQRRAFDCQFKEGQEHWSRRF